ncbi:substrate-binding domain-containing protein [bacterium]|nr:substrate-binding domain-containing protein [bacterium]MBU1754144.1 substrate-binding domain-containing protein [bacterium]
MKRFKNINLIAVMMCVFAIISGVLPAIAAHLQQKNIILATTTSTQDSGLLDVLIPLFEKKTGYFVKTIAVGSGQAIVMGQKGEADVLLVHSPDAEKKFMAKGNGINRKLIMHNNFIIVGPEKDPAGIKGSKLSLDAFRKIASSCSLYMSRGDNSGTDAKEKSIWKSAGINPEEQKWYQQTGLGMGQTLSISAEKKAYTLTDRSTYLALKKNLSLSVLVEGDVILLNTYHIIEVNPARWQRVNAAGAKAFSDFMVSRQAQKIIKNFGTSMYGSPLFFPDAGKSEEKKKKGRRGRIGEKFPTYCNDISFPRTCHKQVQHYCCQNIN